MVKIKRDAKVYRRRREPGEFPTIKAAVRNHCLECVCWDSAEVSRCTAPECWLFPYRLGHNATREILAERASMSTSPARQAQTSAVTRGDTPVETK